jgi:hypothetical protein
VHLAGSLASLVDQDVEAVEVIVADLLGDQIGNVGTK